MLENFSEKILLFEIFDQTHKFDNNRIATKVNKLLNFKSLIKNKKNPVGPYIVKLVWVFGWGLFKWLREGEPPSQDSIVFKNCSSKPKTSWKFTKDIFE